MPKNLALLKEKASGITDKAGALRTGLRGLLVQLQLFLASDSENIFLFPQAEGLPEGRFREKGVDVLY